MRDLMHTEQEKKELRCNVCGEKIKKMSVHSMEDFLSVQKQWGYFSSKDLSVHSFIVCESCYDEWIKSFAIPVGEQQVIEIFDCVDL